MNAMATKKLNLLIWDHAANCCQVCTFNIKQIINLNMIYMLTLMINNAHVFKLLWIIKCGQQLYVQQDEN